MDISSITEEKIRSMIGDLLDEEESGTKVKKVKFPELNQQKTKESSKPIDISFLNDVMVELKVELGRCQLTVGEVLELDVDSVIELNKLAGEEVDVYLNDMPFATAEVVVINEAFGIRISSFVEGFEG
ncbi:MAG TPA: flagellar motor switch protein FliN [Peptococcaceae bacterium]|nr:MAG: Flagellar motor switch/type III secretory pathway protein [Clostridia bacterium 41_269]HBT20160.1 flagellar motor switch protein FliN [Peptococcaceae bacterium]